MIPQCQRDGYKAETPSLIGRRFTSFYAEVGMRDEITSLTISSRDVRNVREVLGVLAHFINLSVNHIQ